MMTGMVPTNLTGSPANRSGFDFPFTSYKGFFLLTVALFIYFSVWALIRPPYQAPDEFWHAARSYAMSLPKWIEDDREVEIEAGVYNPILDKDFLHQISYQRARPPRLTFTEVATMKFASWPPKSGPRSTYTVTGIGSYPPLYYAALYLLGQGGTGLLGLGPYQSFYAYCLSSALISALLWSLVARSLYPWFSDHAVRRAVFFCMVFNPMTAFLSSSINPDAAFIPLAVLAAVYTYYAMRTGAGFGALCATLLATSLVKPSSQVLFPALFLSAAVMPNIRFRRKALVSVAGCFAVSILIFHLWSPAELTTRSGVPPDGLGFLDLGIIFLRSFPGTIKEYWGSLGWLSFTLPRPYYYLLYAIIGLNVVTLFSPAGRMAMTALGNFAAFMALLSLIYSCGVIAGQFLLHEKLGLILQGRYFLPASLGFSLFLSHPAALPRRIFMVYLGFMNLAFVIATVGTYYGGDWQLLAAALPF